ncbi:hypothetical protein LTR66_006584 [Elasticomyces elasticus]|nr:hypothetical protein LTR66_006584 [Elasticomyces elasticus]
MASLDKSQRSSVDIAAAFDAYMRQPETSPSRTFEEFLRNATCTNAPSDGVTGPEAAAHSATFAGNRDVQRHAAPNRALPMTIQTPQKKSSRRVAPAALTLRDQPNTNSVHSDRDREKVVEQTGISDDKHNEYSDWVMVEHLGDWVVVQGRDGSAQS